MSQSVLERTDSLADSDSNRDARSLNYADRVMPPDTSKRRSPVVASSGRRGAAAVLQINPHKLRARMGKLKINWAQFPRREDD